MTVTDCAAAKRLVFAGSPLTRVKLNFMYTLDDHRLIHRLIPSISNTMDRRYAA